MPATLLLHQCCTSGCVANVLQNLLLLLLLILHHIFKAIQVICDFQVCIYTPNSTRSRFPCTPATSVSCSN
jgi:hypothetical protein